jgi:hypothetical protein
VSLYFRSVVQGLVVLTCRRWAKMMYTPEGKKQIDKLWQETLDEPHFAGLREGITGIV